MKKIIDLLNIIWLVLIVGIKEEQVNELCQ